MDKNKIKSYAVWARRAMIEAVKDRAFKVGIEENKINDIEILQGGFKVVGREEIFNIPSTHRDTLVKLINEKGYEQVIEEVAYTWFNRFMGLRFMEVNEYLPTGVRILSSEDEGKTEPDVLTKINDIEDELDLNLDYVYELQDKGTEQAREELYKYILIKQCNELGKIIPQMFEKIQDYTELLLPDNLLQEGSVIRKMVTDIDEEDWKEEVEIIGWMYQYYISEEKDRVIQAKQRYINKEIPFATQLFTPKWIVKYMVQNSLGRYWIESHKEQEDLKLNWEFYLDNDENDQCYKENLESHVNNQLRIEDIKILDPAMGSGHILVYAFDLLYSLYKHNGYSEKEIPTYILNKNLYGLDIDERAVQLASFALIMKSRQYNRRFFREIEKNKVALNIVSIQESNSLVTKHLELLANNTGEILKLQSFFNLFINSKIYGSLTNVDKVDIDIDFIKDKLKSLNDDTAYNLLDMKIREELIELLPSLIKQYEIMKNIYDILITNPPYMGNQYMPEELVKYINSNYTDVKSDLFTAFINYSFSRVNRNGHLAFITPFVWMFIKSYESLRKNIVTNKNISSLIQLEYNSFPEACVPVCTFTLRNYNSMTSGEYIKLSEFKGAEEQPKKVLNAIKNSDVDYRFKNKSYKFGSIDSCPIAYWLSDKFINIFKENEKMFTYANPRQGMSTCDVNKFIRNWYEVNINRTNIIKPNNHENWIMYNKGGGFRRWYGNRENIVFWGDEGKELIGNNAALRNKHSYFKPFIAWTKLSSSGTGFRIFEENFLFDGAGGSLFIIDNDKYKYYLLGVLNSKIVKLILEIISPTINYNENHIGSIPIIIGEKEIEEIETYVKMSISISRKDWDYFETSWDFKIHPLFKLLDNAQNNKIESVFLFWETECQKAFEQLKHNEEELNRIFIDVYGLQDELTPEVEDKDITIRKADRERDIRSFISYAVGCMFGRYSIDAEGLIYAGGDFSDKWKIVNNKWQVRKIEKDEEGNVITDSWVDAIFIPDVDNIIPITEDEYFEDDIVSRFIEFVKVVYGAETLEENLDFIAESLGVKANETSRQTIRRYFLKDFYKDHLKVYQKRPIYWMFDSGKNDGFKALVYMHRYNESTVAKLRTDYLHSLQRKYEAEILRLQTVAESTTLSAREKTQARNKRDKINKKIEECKLYDQVVAHVANERISIDLDDGVKHNYGLFQGIKVPTDAGKEVKMDLLAKI